MEELCLKNKLYEAKYLMVKNKLEGQMSEFFKQMLEDPEILVDNDISIVPDKFAPVSLGMFVKIPEGDAVEVKWVDREDQIHLLDALRDDEFVGVDSEWRPQLSKFDLTKQSILQIGGERTIFIIDMMVLGSSEILDHKLTKLFMSLSTTIVGFNFAADLSAF